MMMMMLLLFLSTRQKAVSRELEKERSKDILHMVEHFAVLLDSGVWTSIYINCTMHIRFKIIINWTAWRPWHRRIVEYDMRRLWSCVRVVDDDKIKIQNFIFIVCGQRISSSGRCQKYLWLLLLASSGIFQTLLSGSVGSCTTTTPTCTYSELHYDMTHKRRLDETRLCWFLSHLCYCGEIDVERWM